MKLTRTCELVRSTISRANANEEVLWLELQIACNYYSTEARYELDINLTLVDAFMWARSPQGDGYWDAVFNNYL